MKRLICTTREFRFDLLLGLLCGLLLLAPSGWTRTLIALPAVPHSIGFEEEIEQETIACRAVQSVYAAVRSPIPSVGVRLPIVNLTPSFEPQVTRSTTSPFSRNNGIGAHLRN